MQTNASKHIWTCLSPQEDMWHLSSWTPSIWDPWEILSTSILSPWRSLSLSPWRISPPLRRWYSLSKMISFDVISLSPFDINFQEGLDKDVISLSPSGICREWVWSLSHNIKHLIKMWCLLEDKIHWVELDQMKHRINGKLFFLWWNRWHRVVCFG